MSFGCGIGDIIQVTKLISRTISSIKKAPSNFSDAEEVVTNLELLYNSVKSEVEKPESVFKRDPAQGERFEALTRSCVASLNKLCDILDKHESLGSNNVKVLDRLRFPKREVNDVQRELQFNFQHLSFFLDTLGIGGVGRIECKMDSLAQRQERILAAMDKIANSKLETASVLSVYSNDDKAVWRQLRRDLAGLGIKSSDMEKHKDLIAQKLLELQQVGQNGEMDDVRSVRSHASVTFIGRTGTKYQPPTVESLYGDSDEEGNYTHKNFRPSFSGAIFEDSDEEDVLDRPGALRERNQTTEARLPAYQDTLRSPRLPIPVQPPQRGSLSAGNSPRQSFPQFPQHFAARSPRQPAPAPSQSASVYGSSPRRSAEAFPQFPRQPSNSPGGDSKYANELRVGRRSASNIIWRYRRPADIQRPERQSADLADGTLPQAAADGRTNDVQRFVLQGYNTESTGSRALTITPGFEGTTALYRAARNKHFETAHLLLRYGANPNTRRNDGKSLLSLLAADGDLEMVRLLLEYGAAVQNQGALPQAALSGHIGVVQLLLNYGVDINEVDKQTALYRASSKGYSDIVDLLLREGAQTDFVAQSGPSALYKAVLNGHYRCVRSLLLYGARPDIGCGQNGESALYKACTSGQEPTVRLLLQHRARPNDTWYCKYRTPAQLRDGRVEEFFPEGPIHGAAREGRLSIAKLLLEYGADVNLRTHYGQTAIDIAFEKEYRALFDLLSSAGGRLSPQNAEIAEKRRTRNELQRSRATYSGRPDDYYDGDSSRGLEVQDTRDIDGRRRSKSSASRSRNEASWRKKGKTSSSGALGAAAAGALLLDSLMLLT